MNTKYIIGTIVVLALIAGGIFYGTRNTAEAPAENTDTQTTQQENTDTNTNEGDESDETSVHNPDGETTGPAGQVSYTADGFTPETVTIKKGESVMFMNESGPRMWVASNIHPTHTLYPESNDSDCLGSAFDMCEGVGAGENWTFTFNEPGEWKFHNHLRANHIGTIIVTDE